jgi:phosphoribosylformylglycinamidine synthase
MRAKVYVRLKNGVLDPQGKAVQQALHRMHYEEVRDVRIGKLIELDLDGMSRENAAEKLKAMCEQLLANTVIESYSFEISEAE